MGGFFKRLEIVTVDTNPKRFCIDSLREEYRKGELVMVADLSDEDGTTRREGIDTERLTKVAG